MGGSYCFFIALDKPAQKQLAERLILCEHNPRIPAPLLKHTFLILYRKITRGKLVFQDFKAKTILLISAHTGGLRNKNVQWVLLLCLWCGFTFPLIRFEIWISTFGIRVFVTVQQERAVSFSRGKNSHAPISAAHFASSGKFVKLSLIKSSAR